MGDHPIGSRGRSRGAGAAARLGASEGTLRPPRHCEYDAPHPILRSRMQVHELTTVRQQGVRGPRALTGAPTRLDSRGASLPLSCDLFRSAGIVPVAVGGASGPGAAVDLSRRLPPRG
jgi:hypothetical protein